MLFENGPAAGEPAEHERNYAGFLDAVNDVILLAADQPQALPEKENVEQDFVQGRTDGDIVHPERVGDPDNPHAVHLPPFPDGQGQQVDRPTVLRQGHGIEAHPDGRAAPLEKRLRRDEQNLFRGCHANSPFTQEIIASALGLRQPQGTVQFGLGDEHQACVNKRVQ